MSRYPAAPLSEGLELALDEVLVDPEASYSLAGIYSFGRGVFHRGEIAGSDTKYGVLFRLHKNQVVLSKLKAFEGAVTVVPDEFEGSVVSPEFPTFRPIEDRCDPRYLAHLCRWPVFWDALQANSQGVGARRERVHTDQFLSVLVPLPALEEQSRIAARLGDLFVFLQDLHSLLARSDSERLTGLYLGLVDVIVREAAAYWVPLGEAAVFVQDVVNAGESTEPAEVFVGLQHIEKNTGRKLGWLSLEEERGPKGRFRPGDILFPRLRPYLNKAWVADCHGLCSIDQFVLRPIEADTAEILGHALRARGTLNQVIELTSSLQLPRIRQRDLGSIPVPYTEPSHRDELSNRLDRLRETVILLLDARRVQVARSDALKLSILNSAFAGSL